MDKLKQYTQLIADIALPSTTKRLEGMADTGNSALDFFRLVCDCYVVNPQSGYFIARKDHSSTTFKGFDIRYNALVNDVMRERTEDDKKRTPGYRDKAAMFAISDFAHGLTRCSGVTYQPGADEFIGSKFNVYQPGLLTPLEGKPEVFLEHMDYLFRDPAERKIVMQFLAHMVRNPLDKVIWSLLIIGKGGTGKSWFHKLVNLLLGKQNVKFVEKGAKIASKWDNSADGKQAIFIDEIIPSDDSAKVQEAIESLVSCEEVEIELKGVQPFKVPNIANVIAVSNHDDALRIMRGARKWAIVRANDDVRFTDAKDQATARTDAYYTRLHGITPKDGTVVTEEARRVLWYLRTQVDLSDFPAQSLAPRTATKDEVAELTREDWQDNIITAMESRRGVFGRTLVTVADVANQYPKPTGEKLTEKAYLAKVMNLMRDNGCRRLMGGSGSKLRRVYLSKESPQASLWTTDKRLLETYEAMTDKRLAWVYWSEIASRKSLMADPLDKFRAPEGATEPPESFPDFTIEGPRTLN
jgi:hypothetical protein